MFFDAEDDALEQHELLQVVSRELFAFNANFEAGYGIRTVPTHTEDGIPIRKIYVSNLPPKTTRTELFGLFAQYGFIKSCWLRMGDKGPDKIPTPTYAFITFSNPADAHKALQAPCHEKQLRGRHLRISPADSWHQPAEDAYGRVTWKPYNQRTDELPSVPTTSDEEPQNNDNSTQELLDKDEVENDEINIPIDEEPMCDDNDGYGILDILNADCLNYILQFVSLRDLIRSERVSKRWQAMIQEHILGIRVFKTSWWQHIPVTLTTAVLRRVLQRVGASLHRLHIDHNWTALNDRTAHTIGKFCPNLEELKVVGMHTKNWNPLIYGCKNLKRLTFISCNKLSDASLVQIVKTESPIEHLAVANNTHVTGLFLTGTNIRQLSSLSFYNCYSLQGTVLTAAIELVPSLTTLKLDVCPITMWKVIHQILDKLPNLEELSLSEYSSAETNLKSYENDEICRAIGALKELRILNLSRNILVTNIMVKQIARLCPKLTSLNVSSCNSVKGVNDSGSYYTKGVNNDGITVVCKSCVYLQHLDVSYLAGLTDTGLANAASLRSLVTITSKGNAGVSSQPFILCLASCIYLKEIDACGCDGVTEQLVEAALNVVKARNRPMTIRLASTPAAQVALPKHELLNVNVDEDRSNPQLRPDFVDHIFDNSSDESLEIYEQGDFEDFFPPEADEDLDDDEELDEDEYQGLLQLGMHAQNLLLM